MILKGFIVWSVDIANVNKVYLRKQFLDLNTSDYTGPKYIK